MTAKERGSNPITPRTSGTSSHPRLATANIEGTSNHNGHSDRYELPSD
jgi:hypothetical protein